MAQNKEKKGNKYIKVTGSIKPKAVKDRKPFDLIDGGNYFVSIRNNMAVRCVLTSLTVPDQDPDLITIKLNGQFLNVFKNEIGRTPEEAVVNEVAYRK